ncbi:MAG: hypothetical protein JWR68_972 [Polaromonas sp.]|nr:hypothetical protein [Polaromonas sp.]
MTEEKDMAKVEGLNLRGSQYYVRVVIPDDLKASYGKTRVNLSLGTSDRRTATLLATIKRAEWLADFEAKRSELKPSGVAAISPQLAALLAERVRASLLADDDRIRSDLPLLAEMVHIRRELDLRALNPLRIPQWDPKETRADDLTGLTPEEADELAGLNAYLDGKSAVALAGRNLAAVLPIVKAEAGKVGVAFDAKTPGAREALLMCLKAYRTAHRERAMRDAGEVIDTPVVLTTSPAALMARALRDVYDRWQLSGDATRSADSIAAYGRALKQFEGQYPATRLEAITREMGDNYRSWLRAECNTPKTARDRLTAIKSLLKYAAETLEWLPKQPWRGLDIKATTTNKRRPWTDEELTRLFAAPLHTAYAIPKARTGGKEAAYWVLLLGLFTGTRLGELCQLRTVDVKTLEGIPVLVLTNEGEDQSIKSAAGHRSVPIHSELIRLGFLGYVEFIQATGADSLWPALPLRKGKPSDLFGRWFKDYREGLGMVGAGGASFHYFRHTVRPLMRRAGFSEGTQDKVTGHKTQGSIGSTVYDHWTLKELQSAVEAIRFPGLLLPAVSPHAV